MTEFPRFTDAQMEHALECAVAAYKAERLKQAEIELDGAHQHRQDKKAVGKAIIAALGYLGL